MVEISTEETSRKRMIGFGQIQWNTTRDSVGRRGRGIVNSVQVKNSINTLIDE